MRTLFSQLPTQIILWERERRILGLDRRGSGTWNFYSKSETCDVWRIVSQIGRDLIISWQVGIPDLFIDVFNVYFSIYSVSSRAKNNKTWILSWRPYSLVGSRDMEVNKYNKLWGLKFRYAQLQCQLGTVFLNPFFFIIPSKRAFLDILFLIIPSQVKF